MVFKLEKENNMNKHSDTAIFAGGCFWCMVEPFDTVDGVKKVVSGYSGGHVANPTYEEVCSGKTGHTEAVKITYDPSKISYEELLNYYWQVTDPTDAMGQFQDRGDNYRPVIFTILKHKKKPLKSLNKNLLKAVDLISQS